MDLKEKVHPWICILIILQCGLSSLIAAEKEPTHTYLDAKTPSKADPTADIL